MPNFPRPPPPPPGPYAAAKPQHPPPPPSGSNSSSSQHSMPMPPSSAHSAPSYDGAHSATAVSNGSVNPPTSSRPSFPSPPAPPPPLQLNKQSQPLHQYQHQPQQLRQPPPPPPPPPLAPSLPTGGMSGLSAPSFAHPPPPPFPSQTEIPSKTAAEVSSLQYALQPPQQAYHQQPQQPQPPAYAHSSGMNGGFYGHHRPQHQAQQHQAQQHQAQQHQAQQHQPYSQPQHQPPSSPTPSDLTALSHSSHHHQQQQQQQQHLLHNNHHDNSVPSVVPRTPTSQHPIVMPVSNIAHPYPPPPPAPAGVMYGTANHAMDRGAPHPPAYNINQQQQHRPGPPPAYNQQQLLQQHPGQPPAFNPQQQQPRINPAQMPRPPLFTHPQDGNLPIYYPKEAVTLTGQHTPVHLPPLADTRFLVIDDGNASPNLLRSTTYNFPRNRGVWHETGDIVLGLLSSPMAVHSEDFVPRPRVMPTTTTTGEEEAEDWRDSERVPIIPSNNNEPPPRCSHCSAYVNPFFGASDGTCNFCGSRNPRSLTEQLSSQLPLQLGTVEYDVGGPYVTRLHPVQPVQLYAVDLTCPCLADYFCILQQLGNDMAQHAWRQQQQQQQQSSSSTPCLPPRMGVCLFSSLGIAIHNLADKNGGLMLASDVSEEPFAPLPLHDWTFDLSTQEGLQAWAEFVSTRLPADAMALKEKGKGKNAYGMDGLELSCGGAALAFMADALGESGGRGTLITWRRPNFGVGKLSHREDRLVTTMRVQEDEAAYTPLQLLSHFKSSQDSDSAKFYKNLGNQCAKDRISLDVLFHCISPVSQTYLDLATLGEFCRACCGKLIWITAQQDWQTCFCEELTRQIQSFIGWDAVFKLRCSAGVQVKSFLCNTGIVQEGLVGSPELELSSVSPTTTVAIELEHRVGGIPKDHPFVFLQSALLYSTPTGKRRVRVSTLAIRVSSIARDVFRSIDFSSTATCLLRQAASRLAQTPAAEGSSATTARSIARDIVYNKCVHLLGRYRKIMGGVHDQLLMPDNLGLLPLFCMSLMKSAMLRPGMPFRVGGTEAVHLRPSNDERAYFIWHASQACSWTANLLVYPRIFNVSLVENNGVGEWQPAAGPESHGFVLMPPAVHPSMEALEDDSVYLLDSGIEIFLYVGKDVPSSVRQNTIGQSLVEWNQVANNLVWQLRALNTTGRGSESELRPTYAPLVSVCQQEGHDTPMEPRVLDLMMDDAVGGERDYVDFLIRLHRAVLENVKNV